MKEWLTEEGEHEDAVISDPQLICIFKVISGHKVLILWRNKTTRKQKHLIPEITDRRSKAGPKQSFPQICFANTKHNSNRQIAQFGVYFVPSHTGTMRLNLGRHLLEETRLCWKQQQQSKLNYWQTYGNVTTQQHYLITVLLHPQVWCLSESEQDISRTKG